MVKQNTPESATKLPKWFYGVIVFVILLITYLFLLTNGQIRYMEAYVKCGWQKPILAEKGMQIGGRPVTDKHYKLPSEGYRIPKAVDIIGSSTYYCTEADAVADGYKHK